MATARRAGVTGVLLFAVVAPAASAVPAGAATTHPAPQRSPISAFDHPRAMHRPTSHRAVRMTPVAAGPTLHVNGATGTDGSNTCRLQADPCLTIGHAVAEAPAAKSTTIAIAAGTYPEEVIVPAGDDITLNGAGASSTTIQPASVPTSDADTDGSIPVYPIVDALPGSTLNVKNLTVSGAAASSTFDSCADDFTGVYFHDASGSMSSTTVSGIQLSASLFGCQDGLAVYVAADAGSTSAVTMTSVTVHTYQKNGITCDDAGTTCTISNSTVTGIGPSGVIAQNGIQGYLAGSVSLSNDTVTGNTYTAGGYSATGVLLIDNAATSVSKGTVKSNDDDIYVLADGSAPSSYTISIQGVKANSATGAYGDGIDLDSTAGGTVSGNTVTLDPEYGIGIYGATGATISGNTATKDGEGIYVGSGSVVATSTGNAVSGNTTSTNAGDGILATVDTSGNTFSSNKASKNPTYDYQDQSSGAGTAGTANTWTSGTNACTPTADSQPEGLC